MKLKVNYLKEILAFNNSAVLDSLSTGQIALWYALMYIDNNSGWEEHFTATNAVLSLYTGLSRSGILKARAELQEKGYIFFSENGTKATEYSLNFKCLIAESKQDSVQDSVQESTQAGKQADAHMLKSTQDSVQESTQDSNTLFKTNINKNIYNYQRAANTPSRSRPGQPNQNRFHNFHERDTDIDALEQQLISNG